MGDRYTDIISYVTLVFCSNVTKLVNMGVYKETNKITETTYGERASGGTLSL
jgi:hypothetical protein